MADDNVVWLRDYRNEWKEVFTTDGPDSTLQVYVNRRTGEAEIVQQNDDNETIRTTIDIADAQLLIAALSTPKQEAK